MCDEINYNIYRNSGNEQTDGRTDRQIHAKSICEIHIICQCTINTSYSYIWLLFHYFPTSGCLLMRGTIWHKMF